MTGGVIETKHFDDSPTGEDRPRFSTSGMKAGAEKNAEERKLDAVYRVLRAIHTDVIPTRTLLPPSPLAEGREKFPMRIGKGIHGDTDRCSIYVCTW